MEQLKAQNVIPTLKKCGLMTVIMLHFFLSTDAQTSSSPKEPKRWYETISLRGYMQVRYNRLLETNPKLKCEQCDRSWGRMEVF